MKKKISILMICLMMTLVTACGKEDEKAEDVSAEVQTEAEDTEPDEAVKDIEPDEAIKEPEEPEASDNLKLEEQVDELENDNTPPASEEDNDAEPDIEGNDGLLECDIVPCGTYDLDGNRYVIVSTYDDDDSGDCMLMFGCYDGTYSGGDYYDLELVENHTYIAKNSGSGVSVTVTFSDGGMDLSGGTGELEGFNGHYTYTSQ